MAFSSAEGITLRIYRLWLQKKKTCNSLFRQFTDLRFFKNLVAKLLGFFERGKEKRDERGGSDSFSGRRKLFWGNDDHLKSRAALSFQLDLLVLQQYYSCAIWTLRRNYRGISLDETLLESSLREKAEWKLSKSPKCSGLLSVSHQWKKTAIYGGLIPQSAPSYTLIHKNTVFSFKNSICFD